MAFPKVIHIPPRSVDERTCAFEPDGDEVAADSGVDQVESRGSPLPLFQVPGACPAHALLLGGMAVEKVVLRPARDGRLYRIGLMRHGKAPVMVMLNRRRGTRLSMAVLSLSSTVCCC